MNKKIAVIFIVLSLFSDHLLAKSFFNKVKKTTSKAASTTNKTVIKPTDTKVIQPTNANVAQPVYDDALLPTENNVLTPMGDDVDQVFKATSASSYITSGNQSYEDEDYNHAVQYYIHALAWEYDLGYAPAGSPDRDKLWSNVEDCLKQNQTADYKSYGLIVPSHVKDRIDGAVNLITSSRRSSTKDAMYDKTATILYDIGVHKYNYEQNQANSGDLNISNIANFLTSSDFFVAAYELNNTVFVGGSVPQSLVAASLYSYGTKMMNAKNDDGSSEYDVSDYADYFATAQSLDSKIVIPDKVKTYLDNSN